MPLAGFADTVHDVRSICIAVIDAPSDVTQAVIATKPLGSPVVLACHAGRLQWWKQTTNAPVLVEPPIDGANLQRFFLDHNTDLSPKNIYEGKTLRRLPGQTQLSFVDAGLMPFVERADGEGVGRLLEAAFRSIESELGRKLQKSLDIQNAIKATFWLLAAKTLRDKSVDGFKTLALTDVDDVFACVGRHYGVPDGVPPPGKAWHSATNRAATTIDAFGSLRNLSTESLAHVYENAMVTAEVRKANGTHSTPGALVDYMVWQLWPWIEQLSPDRRHVFEPACGHAAFLVSALRVLRQWSDITDGAARHSYLKKHLHGVEYDPFALEVARLSLTLADIPFGNTWDLRQADMFQGTLLEDGASKCGVLLANPPYEKFTSSARATYARDAVQLVGHTKACEMLRRTIPHMSPGACFGVVVPLSLLHNREATELRKTILSDFELSEIAVFEDKLFAKGDHEAAILMGRRKTGGAKAASFWFRRVTNREMPGFRERFAFSSEQQVDVARFLTIEAADLRVPELGAVWTYLGASPRLESLASVGKGLDHRGRDLPPGEWTIHDPPQKGDQVGFANVSADLSIFRLPVKVGVSLTPSVLLSVRSGMPPGKPQVLLNYAPVSRNAWRLKATLDRKGLALTSRFIAVRPTADASALYLWALLNSPVANAFAFCQLGKRDILVGTMRQMPVPTWSPHYAHRIEQAAMRYRDLAAALGPLYNAAATPDAIKQALLEMDAAVLQAYDLPPRLERQLLDLFTDVERKGVGCAFTGYYPAGFSAYLPLHLVISDRFQRAAADVTVDRVKPGESPHIQAALGAATADEE